MKFKSRLKKFNLNWIIKKLKSLRKFTNFFFRENSFFKKKKKFSYVNIKKIIWRNGQKRSRKTFFSNGSFEKGNGHWRQVLTKKEEKIKILSKESTWEQGLSTSSVFFTVPLSRTLIYEITAH